MASYVKKDLCDSCGKPTDVYDSPGYVRPRYFVVCNTCIGTGKFNSNPAITPLSGFWIWHTTWPADVPKHSDSLSALAPIKEPVPKDLLRTPLWKIPYPKLERLIEQGYVTPTGAQLTAKGQDAAR